MNYDELGAWLSDIDTGPAIDCYSVNQDNEIIDWFNTLDEAKKFINTEVRV